MVKWGARNVKAKNRKKVKKSVNCVFVLFEMRCWSEPLLLTVALGRSDARQARGLLLCSHDFCEVRRMPPKTAYS